MRSILEIEDLSISYSSRDGAIPAVTNFSCTVLPGETMGIVGESGCGKSTVALGILRGMGNQGHITGGRIRYRGQDLVRMSEAELRRIRGREIAMVYQEPMASLNPSMRIGRQLMEVPVIHEGTSKAEARRRSLEMLEAVRLPDPERIMDAYPHQLSGGQQQRAVIAMALLSRPGLLLLDEPTTALDVTVEAEIVALVKDLSRRFGTSLLFISHNLGLILESCDRITVMYAGQAVETGTVADVFRHIRHPYTQGLFRSIPLPDTDKNTHPLTAIPGQQPLAHERPANCRFAPRCDHFRPGICDLAEIPMLAVAGQEGHFSRCARVAAIDWAAAPRPERPDLPAAPGKPLLRVEGARKYYDVPTRNLFGHDDRKIKAVENVSFHALEGETLAIVGESGCGKSTLARMLLGLETVTAGTVSLSRREIGSIAVEDRDPETVASIQMVFQNPSDTLNPSHSVGAQIMRTLEVFGVGDSVAARRQAMHEILDLVKLPQAIADRMPGQLSGGQKQRIGIARAFAARPSMVVADEALSALDVSVQAAVTELLIDIQRRGMTTMLFISHDLSMVRYIADRVLVMYLGQIVEQGTTGQVFSPPYHPYTEALLSAIPVAHPHSTRNRVLLKGEIPSALNPPAGCPFHTRCRYKHLVPGNLCETSVPAMRELADGHGSRCHLGGVGSAARESP